MANTMISNKSIIIAFIYPSDFASSNNFPEVTSDRARLILVSLKQLAYG